MLPRPVVVSIPGLWGILSITAVPLLLLLLLLLLKLSSALLFPSPRLLLVQVLTLLLMRAVRAGLS